MRFRNELKVSERFCGGSKKSSQGFSQRLYENPKGSLRPRKVAKGATSVSEFVQACTSSYWVAYGSMRTRNFPEKKFHRVSQKSTGFQRVP